MSLYAALYLVLLVFTTVMGVLLLLGPYKWLAAFALVVVAFDLWLLIRDRQPMAYVSRWIDNYRYGRKPD